jgi:phosphoglucomutase
VLQWFTEDGMKISVRPSGTEPKIKFYCEVPVAGFDGNYEDASAKADARIADIKKSLGL